ncbi:MAG: putative acetyltransferase [Parasphingorhabdus sp.]|jgi:putative acetyltransferase
MSSRNIQLKTPDDMDLVREMFQEYQDFLNEDLCFQDFNKELADLPGKYTAPQGMLLFAYVDDAVAGCVALRPLDEDGACEMKRLYVRTDFRGLGLGRRLAESTINAAMAAGYRCMRLDTLERLEAAIRLYESLDFKRSEPYVYNPLGGVTFWQKDLV